MANFIECNGSRFKSGIRSVLFINIQHIEAVMEPYKGTGAEVCTENETYHVKETVREVMTKIREARSCE